MNELHLYNVDMKYIRDLARVDDNVASVSPQIGKHTRPFVGVVVLLNGKDYCIPLASPKNKFSKKSQIDFIKIFDEKHKDSNGTPKLIGVLNINNMIPVDKTVISKINLTITSNDSKQTLKYKQLMQNQIKWCRKHVDIINNRANKVYSLVVDTPNKNINLTRRCLNFKLLESVLEKRMQRTIKEEKSFTISRKVMKENANRVKADACFAKKKSKHHTHNI